MLNFCVKTNHVRAGIAAAVLLCVAGPARADVVLDWTPSRSSRYSRR
jgi:hypothetical protein